VIAIERGKRYRCVVRMRDDGRVRKPGIEALEGRELVLYPGWEIDDVGPPIDGEFAMLEAEGCAMWNEFRVSWIASGDVEVIGEAEREATDRPALSTER
jgi:hypothetical protein